MDKQTRKVSVLSVIVLASLFLAACTSASANPISVTGSNPIYGSTPADSGGSSYNPVPASPTAVPAFDVVINVASNSRLGKILVDSKGMTLYMYTRDEANKSNCSGGCLVNWPPFITQGSPKAGVGVDQSLIGVASLSDGRKIVTYNKMPLYYWIADKMPGDTAGQDVNKVWYVVSPEGKPIGMGQ